MYLLLKPRIHLQTFEWRKAHSWTLHGTIFTWLVDGSEQEVLSSGNPFTNTKFFSVKKGKHTINKVAIISATGKRILYLTPSYPGSMNDPLILDKTMGDWYPEIDEQEHGLGDSIFTGYYDKGIRLDTPPRNRKDLYRLYAVVRVTVENVFDFAVTKMPLRIPPSNEQEILEYHNNIWVVVAALINDFRC